MSKREYRLARDEFLNEYVKVHGLCTLDELVVVEIAKTCANWGREYNNEENAKAYTDLKQQANKLYEAYKYALGFDNPKDCIDHIGKAIKTYEDYLAEPDKEG